MRYGRREFRDHMNSLRVCIASLSTTSLVELEVRLEDLEKQDLKSVEAGLADLEILDDLLARPQFTRLRRIRLKYGSFSLAEETVVGQRDVVQSPGRSTQLTENTTAQSSSFQKSQPNAISRSDDRNSQDRFRHYAEQQLRSRIKAAFEK